MKEELPKKKSSLPLRQAKRPAKFGRTGFRRNFAFGELWKGKLYATKQVEVYAAKEDDDWLAIMFVTRFF